MRSPWLACAGAALAILAFELPVTAQRPSTLQVRATTTADLRQWDSYVTTGARDGALRLRTTDRDPALPARTLERFDQFHDGVRVWGADIVRDSETGVPRSIFGALASDVQIDTTPALDGQAGTAALLRLFGAGAVELRSTELVILPMPSGDFHLAYTGVVSSKSGVYRAFVDARDGSELLRYSEIETESAVGTGKGVLGDTKKLSVLQLSSTFMTDDQHRPPVLRTYDMHGNIDRAIGVVFGGAPLFTADLATDTDDTWTDPAVVDAHVHVGWTYDYYYKRFGRRGLDNHDRPLVILTNGATQQDSLTADPDLLGLLYVNAFWCDDCGPNGIGAMYFGNGIPPGYYVGGLGRNYTYFSGALDIVAHELTHGVTSSTSNLIYFGESGALNEAFSDMMGKSVEFYYHPPGSAPGQADYTLGKDISRAIVPGALNGDRSMSNPGLYGDPDHYSKRYTGSDDNGGVHTNSGIANQAFYLAIEGGTNRTSGLSVKGVGSANREQIEQVFYRAFAFLMPANSTFSTARAATIQAARDLYGAGSSAETAVTQAWTAVGVF